MPATTLPSPTERLASIIAWLAASVAEQGHHRRLAGTLVVAIWTRLHRIAASFRAVAATPIPPPRPPRPEQAAPVATQDPDAPPQPTRAPRRPPAMPYGARWLLRLIASATVSLAQLEDLLRDPQMAALLAADPRLGRILRALCWALGVHRDLAPPPRRRRKPQAAALPPAEPDPDHPAAPGFAPHTQGRSRRKRFNLRGRDLLTRLRMGPSPIWA